MEKDLTTLCVSGAPVQEGLPCRCGRVPSTHRGAHAAEEEGRTSAALTVKPGPLLTFPSWSAGAEGSSGGPGPRRPEAAAVHTVQRRVFREELHLGLCRLPEFGSQGSEETQRGDGLLLRLLMDDVMFLVVCARWPVSWISCTPPGSICIRCGTSGSSSWISASSCGSSSRTRRR